MFRKLHILLVILCLGIVFSPAQNNYVAEAEMACCQSPSQDNDCCGDKSEIGCHESKDDKNADPCKDSCKTCHTCNHTLVNFIYMTSGSSLEVNNLISKNAFLYAFPFIVNSTFNIWQPPKLA